MGARSRLISTQALNLGWAYGVDGTGIAGNALFTRPNGKAIQIASVSVAPGAVAAVDLTKAPCRKRS